MKAMMEIAFVLVIGVLSIAVLIIPGYLGQQRITSQLAFASQVQQANTRLYALLNSSYDSAPAIVGKWPEYVYCNEAFESQLGIIDANFYKLALPSKSTVTLQASCNDDAKLGTYWSDQCVRAGGVCTGNGKEMQCGPKLLDAGTYCFVLDRPLGLSRITCTVSTVCDSLEKPRSIFEKLSEYYLTKDAAIKDIVKSKLSLTGDFYFRISYGNDEWYVEKISGLGDGSKWKAYTTMVPLPFNPSNLVATITFRQGE